MTLAATTLALITTISPAEAQQYWGPYQPYAHAPRFYYYNPSAPRYPFQAPVYNSYRPYSYGVERELRQLRWELEDARIWAR